MRDFFLNLNKDYQITLFSISHIILIVLTLVIVALIIYNRKKFTNLNPKTKNIIRISFGVLLLLNFIIRRGSFIYYGVYDWHYHLDINFCNFTTILFIVYVFSGNKKILNISYHMAFVGPLLAIILPSYNLLPLSYSFYSFVLMHHILFIFTLIIIYMEELKWNKKLLFSVIEFLLIYFAIIFTFDYTFGLTYNLPLTFVNNSITNISFINSLVNNQFVVYIIYFILISLLLLLGNYVLKTTTKD